jgi:hypothetical protein
VGEFVKYCGAISMIAPAQRQTSSKLPITEVIIGPKIDFERNEKSMTKLIADCGFNDVKIRKSSISIR